MLSHQGALRRAGFTIIEMLVAMTFMGLVAAAIVVLLLRQQRFYSSTSELVQTRQQVRQAAFILPADLRAISRAGGDIYVMTDSSIEFRATFGSAVACTVRNDKSWVTTVPQNLARGSAMTNWKQPPAVNDSLALYDDSSSTAQKDDYWSVHRVTKVVQVPGDDANGCPSSSKLALVADLVAGNPSYQLTVSPNVSKTAYSGAGLRFFRRVHYSLYRWATDNRWYLGYYDCVPNRVPVCNTIQPIAGPLRPYATDGTSGLQFTYYDSTGVVTANKTLVARISAVVRAQGQSAINLGNGSSILRDSLRIDVALRNRN